MMDMKIKKKSIARRIPFGKIIISVLFSLLFILPFWMILVSSLSENSRLQAEGVSLWFKGFSLAGYKFVFSMNDTFLRSLWFSLWTATLSAALSTVVCVLAAYALSKKTFVGRKVLNFFIMFTMFFSGGQIPTYLVIRGIGIYDTPWALILPGVASAYSIMLVRNFFYGIPVSLDEAARLDGASDLQILLKVYTPLSKTIGFTIFFTTFVAKWNQWLPSLLYAGAQNKRMWTVQYVLNQIINDAQSIFGNSVGGGTVSTAPLIAATNAAIVIVILPLIILSPLVQRFFVHGAAAGAVKE